MVKCFSPLLGLSIIVIGGGFQSVRAATIAVSTSVNADVVPSCFIASNPDINFGSLPRTISGQIITISQTDLTGSINVSCSTGFGYTLFGNMGANGSNGQRRLKNSVADAYINYMISGASAGGADFPTSSAGALSYTGIGSPAPIPLYVRIPNQTISGTSPRPGLFADAILFTVNF